MKARTLVISYTALMASSPNGRTMQSLLHGIPQENISLFCCYGTPDKGSCASCYKVSNRDALNSLLKPGKAGTIIDPEVDVDQVAELEKDKRNGPKKAWKYLAKEIVWALGGWENKRFWKWLHEQQINCVIYMYGDNAALQNLAVKISRKLNVPLIVYSCEDYCFKNFNYLDRKEGSLWFWLFQRMTNGSTRKLFRYTDGLITNADRLGREYQNKYGLRNVATVMMASQMEFVWNAEISDMDQIEVTYLGALGHYRIRALTEIGDALQRIDPALKLNVYGRIVDETLREQLENCAGVKYHGFVSYEEVQRVMRRSTLLIETINDDPYIIKNKRYGFSTKYADCFACGTPLLVYAPEEIIETQFAKENDCAFVVSSIDELEDTLKMALFDENARNRQVNAAKRITGIYFDKQKNTETVLNMICDLTEK